MSNRIRPLFLAARALPFAACLALLPAAPAAAQQDPDLKAKLAVEIRYIDALNKAGLPDYADLVIKDLQAKYPQAKALIKVKALEQHLVLGHFEDAEKIIKAEPNQDAPETWAMRLTMADYLFARGRYDEAFGTYQTLFKKYGSEPPEAIVEFYVNSAYKFAQMLMFQKRDKDAAEQFKKLLAIKGIPKEMIRQVQFEYAQLLVKIGEETKSESYLADAKKAVEPLLWNQDLWFGKGVALLAHIEAPRGKYHEARKTVESYRSILEGIDDQLAENGRKEGVDYSHLSPIAEGRYLMGTLFADAADRKADESAKLQGKQKEDLEDEAAGLYEQAMTELQNVYVAYPSYNWSSEAISRVEKIEKRLSDMGFEVASSITPAQKAEVARKRFETAGMLFHQNRFEEAIQAYQTVLASYPEIVPESITALGLLAQSCVEHAESFPEGSDDREFYQLYAGAVQGYVAERFCRAGKAAMIQAGDALRTLSSYFQSHNLLDLSRRTMDDFFRLYPEHTQAANSLMFEAERLYKADPPDYEAAIPKYKMLAENYRKSPVSFDAQRRLADCYGKTGQPELELEVRSNYLARVSARKKPGPDLVIAQYSYAKALRTRQIERLREANRVYEELRRGGAAAAAAATNAAPEGAEAPADPVEAARRELIAANKEIGPVISLYGRLVKMLEDPQSRALLESGAQQKKLNDAILQSALFDRAYCLSSLNQPESAIPKYKQEAIKTYEKVLELFPEAEGRPVVLLQLGTLYSTLRTDDPAEQEANAKKAAEYFDDLSKNHADSEQARNALYLQAKALMDLGYRTEAIRKYGEMIDTPGGRYNALQLVTAADELVRARVWDLAEKGYAAAAALLKPEEKSLRPRIDLGMIEIRMARKMYKEAVPMIEAFLEANPRSARAQDAYEQLRTAAVQTAIGEAEESSRDEYFTKAIVAVQKLRAYKKGEKAALDLQLQIGDIMEAQVKAERDHRNEAAVPELQRKASAHYQGLVMGYDTKNANLLPELEILYARAPRTLADLKTYTDGSSVFPDVKKQCEDYLALFPEGPHVAEVRRLLTTANIEMAGSGSDEAESAPAAPSEAPAEEAPAAEAPAEEPATAPAEEDPAPAAEAAD